MVRVLSEEEILKIKNDKNARDKIKAELEVLAQIGQPLRISIDRKGHWTRLSHHTATEDAIRIFCDCIGNFNPLYRSRDYARNSAYGGIIAPPNFLTAISIWGGAMYGDYGGEHDIVRHMFNAGHEAEFFKVIRAGDKFTVNEIQTEVKDLTREDTGLQYLACAKKVYQNQRNEVVAIVDVSVIMMPKFATNRLPPGIAKRQPKIRHFSEQEVENWYRLMLKEPIQGGTPRFWEDVNVGDQLPPIHQVYSIMDHASWETGGGYGISGDWRFRMSKEHLGEAWKWNTKVTVESGLPEHAIGHLHDAAARLEGLPRAYAGGGLGTSWIYNMITNWMGDTGFVKKVYHQYRRQLWRDSMVLCKGQVTKKYIEGDEHLVDLSTTVEDHNGDFWFPSGTATVALPSRQSYMETYRPR